MLDRLWWFGSGVVVGAFIAVRAIRRTPKSVDVRYAAAHTGADVLDFAARAVKPRR